MRFRPLAMVLSILVLSMASVSGQGNSVGNRQDGKRLFDREAFDGNGRTCLTCHSRETGTVSPEDALARFQKDPFDLLFIHDGSDDGQGTGVSRMLADATVLVNISLPSNVQLAGSSARFVTLRRGIASTLNTPALDPVLMLDGRKSTLEDQATGAISDHAQAAKPRDTDLVRIAQFQQTDDFFSSPALRNFARGGAAPALPPGNTDSEKRGRRFFEDVPPDPAEGFRPGLCSHCHSGPLLNQTNQFAPDFIGVPIPTGTRFMNVAVSFFNQANNPVNEFIFNGGVHLSSPDPGRALITGDPNDFEVFKISPLRGIRRTAPYFHDNSAKTLEDVAAHYTRFFAFVTGGFLQLTPQDEADMVAFMKLLD